MRRVERLTADLAESEKRHAEATASANRTEAMMRVVQVWLPSRNVCVMSCVQVWRARRRVWGG